LKGRDEVDTGGGCKSVRKNQGKRVMVASHIRKPRGVKEYPRSDEEKVRGKEVEGRSPSERHLFQKKKTRHSLQKSRYIRGGKIGRLYIKITHQLPSSFAAGENMWRGGQAIRVQTLNGRKGGLLGGSGIREVCVRGRSS